jgi:hypothetical protein
MPVVSSSTKIRDGRNRKNKTDFQNIPFAAPPILGRWPVYQVRVD